METQSARSQWVRGDCIGRGSFGEVSLAVSRSDGSVFAAKSIDLTSAHPSQIEALENEVQILRSISSPFVVGYLGCDCTRESTGAVHRNLLMEYMPSGSVSDGAPNLDEQTVRSYTWCVVSALQYAHSRGIVHCDVKGKNVLVGSAPGVAKLGDFGSAKRLGVNGDGEQRLVMRGSPLWMAPEVIRQEKQGPESDVWSLGCTVIEMMSGKPAWKDCGVATVYQIGLSEELPEFPDGLSELGRDFLDKCLKRDPSERWTCEQLLRHPFVSVDHKLVIESSPRSVLSWPNSEFPDDIEEEEEEERETETQFNLGNLVISGERRIGELASGTGAVWESDGWEVVRSLSSVSDRDGGAVDGEGANWGFWVSERAATEAESGVGIREEYSDLLSGSEGSEGASWECWSSGSWSSSCYGSCCCWGGCRAGSGCQHGLEKENIAVVKHENWHNYRCCCCKLLLLLLLFILTKSSLVLLMRFRSLLLLLWNSSMEHVGTVSLSPYCSNIRPGNKWVTGSHLRLIKQIRLFL